MHWKGERYPPPLQGAQPLSPGRQGPASMAFITDRNRPQPRWQPPPTACLTASAAASEAPSLLMHPWVLVLVLRLGANPHPLYTTSASAEHGLPDEGPRATRGSPIVAGGWRSTAGGWPLHCSSRCRPVGSWKKRPEGERQRKQWVHVVQGGSPMLPGCASRQPTSPHAWYSIWRSPPPPIPHAAIPPPLPFLVCIWSVF